jgi:hypothetical protein
MDQGGTEETPPAPVMSYAPAPAPVMTYAPAPARPEFGIEP